jgi:hypothetical protein
VKPAGQVSHAVLPAALAKEPLLQAMHLTAAAVEEYVPTGHGVQSAAAADSLLVNVPAAQA